MIEFGILVSIESLFIDYIKMTKLAIASLPLQRCATCFSLNAKKYVHQLVVSVTRTMANMSVKLEILAPSEL